MSALRDAMSHAALGWVKPELDETLRQVRGEIEAFVEEPADTGRMRFCAGYLHQVQGTLRMVELYAPAMVAEELELLATAVQNGQAADRDEACATLMRGTVLLPDYLERLQDGHRDIPIVLLPLLNEIRAARGEAGLSEGALFALAPDTAAATEAELDHARGSLAGRNRELLDTVGTAIKEELLRVKDALDLHLRTGGDVAALQTQVDELGSVADTLGVMGLGVARSVVVQQRDALRSIVDGARAADEGLLLDIAGALLYVDASLDDQVAYLGAGGDVHDDASAAEARRTVEVLAHEAIANFGSAREHFVAFIETNWDHARLDEVPRLLAEVAGALRMLELPQPADYLEGVRRYVGTELIGKRRVPSGRQLDTLADAMASLEYYLEALRERRPGREEILDITRSSLEALRYWPLPDTAPAAPGVLPSASEAAESVAPLPPVAADRIDVSAPPSIAAPAVPAWDLAPAEDTLETTPRTQDAAPSAPQAPQWSLATDDADTAAEHASAPADDGAARDEHEPTATSQALSFDPVAAEQDSWTGTAEPLHISLDSLVLEQDALRPQTPSTLAHEDDAAAASAASASDVAGFDPVAAEYPEQAQTDVPAAFAGLDEHDDPNLIIVDTPTAAEDADASTPPLVIELEDAPAFADAPGGSADEVHTLDWHAAPDAQDEQAASALSPDAAALADAGAHIAHGERLDAAAEAEPADAGADAEDAAHAIPSEAAEATDAARETESHAPMDGPAQTDAGLAAIDEAAHTDAVADAPSAPEHAALESEEHATPEPVQEHAAPVSDAEAAFLADLEAAAAQFDVTAAAHSGEPAAAAPASAEASAAPAAAPPAAETGFIDGDGEIDEEIRAVFLEEFDEELVNLGALLPAWRAAPAHTESLRPIRRVFHTLKGSGRLVGARVLGEFSWKIESMLNRVLDGSRPASPAVVAMVEQAYAVLPQLNAALRGNGTVQADLDAIQTVAERIAAGEEAFYFATPQAAVAPRAGTPASVDSVLREILEAEVATHLETVHAWLQHAPQPATEALLRAVHTMSGAFAMTDVPEITAVTGPAESYVKRALASGSVPSADGVRALEDAARAIAATIAELQAPSPVIPPFTELSQRLRALVETLPEVQWPPIAHDEDDEDLSASAPAEAGLDEQAVQAVELTAADDLSAFLGDAAHLHEALPVDDVAGQSDAVDADQHRIDVHTDAASAQSSDGAAASTPADSDATTDTDVGTLASASEDEPLAVEPAAAQDHAQSHDAAPGDEAAAPHDERDADEQAALAQDGQLDELTVEAPLSAEQVSDPVPEALDPAAQDATVDAVIADAATDTPMDAQELQAPEHAGEAQGSEAHAIEAQDGEARDASVHAPESQVSDHSAADRDADADATEAQATDHSAADHAVEDHATDAQASDSQDASAHGQDAQASEHDATHGDADAPIDDTAEAHEQQLNEDAPAIGLRQHPLAPSSGWRHDGVASANDDTGSAAEHGDATPDAAAHPEDATHEGDAASLATDTVGEHTDAEADAEHVAPTGDAGDGAPHDDAAEAEHAAHATPSDGEAASDAHHAAFDEAHHAPEDAVGQNDTTKAADADTASAGDIHEEHHQHAPEATASAPADTDAAQAAADAARTDLSAVDLGPLDFADLDRELVDIFVDEGKDLLDHCDRLIAELRAAPQDRDVLGGLQRDLHTLKGGARMAGINAIGDLGHGIESLLEAVAAHRTELDRQDVQLLERGFDRLHQLLTLTGNHRAVAMPQDLIGAFDARTHGQRLAAASDAETTVAAPLAAADGALAAAALAAVAAPLSAPLPVEGTPDEEATIARPMQEQVRVRADLLDRLVNHAGEVAIYRSRLEQQLGAFRGAMAELDRTNARLRDQLRRLDLETEAQIVARYQREQDQTEQSFDPLELDRFSTLQQLSRALNESAADLGGLQGVLDDLARQYDGLLQQQSRVSSELQDGLMRARMVPFDGLVPRLRRVVRQAASETGKQVHLSLEGTHGELDRNVLDRMVAPLEHMLRNSVAHGLEAPEQRRAAGKAEEGNIAIRLRREGSEIVLEVADDGAGLDREAIRRRAEQRGLIAADAVLSDDELDALIFAPGFSTYDQVSQLAGRGVGMDVVRNEVRQLGGSVDIHSVRGQGVTFTLRLPQTLAVTQAVFVQIGETTFAVPVASVSGIGRIGRERFEAGTGGYRYSGEEYALHDLGSLVGQAPARAEGQAQVPLLLVRAGDLRAAVAIDQVLGNREIVVKPVGLQIASVPGIYGATITGDGRVVVILDIAPLVRRFLAQPQRPVVEAAPTEQRRVPLVMVVDDSLTMRKVTGRVLERHNFDVVSARDGVEALERLEERVPDLMLLDIEMPRMDGYELATAMRADPRYAAVPIVMITSRSGEKHRQRAFELGVQRYLGKPYQELDLMRNVYDLLGIARVRE
ncbi:Sensor histidine kinase RcsC [Xanthomonas sacchari]|uniref:Hpt domain-containing protein n=2 Tax=Xanthomonas sacchari TaxID=56458 RepID=UPI00225799FA|nr:Hpt domain-containing protein [Xanthomonas sacchari]MCW0394358.1 Sensor histidine kinase RcsC [Xanthomonas sacchari]MCW0443228.1 Sensor histidine kinase RcsC [Xanthomonas sacchari]